MQPGAPKTGAARAPMSSARRRGFRWGFLGAAVAHAGANLVRRSRVANALGSALRATFGSVARVLHLLWLQITGLFFVAFAVIGGSAAWYEYSRHKTVSGRVVAALCFTVVFGWFGVSSFWRAGRKRPAGEK